MIYYIQKQFKGDYLFNWWKLVPKTQEQKLFEEKEQEKKQQTHLPIQKTTSFSDW